MQNHIDKRNPDFEDPKIILTASLLRQRDIIVAEINNGDAISRSKALTGMATLITQLDIDPEETDLVRAKKELVDNTIKSVLPASSVMHYFQIINDRLNATYFAEFHGRAKPRNPNIPTLKLPGANQ